MSRRVKYILFFLIVLLAGLARFTRISEPMMHNDEAVNAHMLGVLLETGEYQYNREEYHGPALYYLSLVFARLSGHETYASLLESTLRMVPAFFSLLTIVLLVMLRKRVEWTYILMAGVMMALAPMMVFYGRYFIHESLLTFFSLLFFLSIFRYIQGQRLIWVVIAGVSAGLMHATKETFVINLLAALPALLAAQRWSQAPSEAKGPAKFRIPLLHWVLFLGTGALTSVLFFSSFFSNPKGILDSVTTYAQYFRRAGQDDAHIHPWYYYLSLLAGPWKMDGWTASELWLLVTAMAGYVWLWVDRRTKGMGPVLLFFGNYSLILLLIYSFIPYKTPWNILQFYPGLLLLSGYSILRLWRAGWPSAVKGAMLVLVLAGGVHWVWSGMKLNFQYEDDPVNPYVYAHTSPDVRELATLLDTLVTVHPDGYKLPVEVIFPGHDYWPLPWYLRRFENVGFYDRVDWKVPASPIVIVSPEVEGDLVRKLYELPPPGERYLYTSLFESYLELRPGVECRCYARKEVWDLVRYIREWKDLSGILPE